MAERLTASTAAHWVRRWELQQERYATDREERFTVIADVVEQATADSRRPLLADLGCGPGSLATRLAARLPDAEIVAVDCDPLLLELGRRHPGTTGQGSAVRYTDARIGQDGWTEQLGLKGRRLDAAVSTTALHYPSERELLEIYAALATLLRPGGVLVNGDHLGQPNPSVAALAARVGRRRADRLGVRGHENWEEWWTAAARAPELAPLLAERHARGLGPGADNGLNVKDHQDLLAEAGFSAAGPVWQYGSSCVLVAVR
ncbi:class I SAM-dependent methyltransferase [Streptomyces sp. ACA25]|uniref:class I SAM-dependent methyltransferase n=1 Tax=Streptomyces sp. ACA25 TaxID=3022596 RepID=UPI002307E23F|nr:class I SAM-dependent methyltransferase [Streptomyces sp. ACA25]MDB1089065.1 class I SAM-dependent methyltransferase [Streptomyces sp. ACA25]